MMMIWDVQRIVLDRWRLVGAGSSAKWLQGYINWQRYHLPVRDEVVSGLIGQWPYGPGLVLSRKKNLLNEYRRRNGLS